MPSTMLLFGLLLLYVINTGRLTALLTNAQALIQAGLFKPGKLAEKSKGEEELPEGKKVLPGVIPEEPLA